MIDDLERLRRVLAAGGAGLVIGIALSASQNPWGGWLVVLGLAALVFGLHRYGRTGPDVRAPLARPTRKRRKPRRPRTGD